MTTPLTQPPASQSSQDGGIDKTTQKHMLWTLAVVAGVLGLVALVFVVVSTTSRGRPLYPSFPQPTPPNRVINAEVETISFVALNDNPAAYLNRHIRATGDYTPLELPTCRPFAGPPITWSLVADSLQLNATGYEHVLRLAEPGLTLTVEGIWRLHSGPVGCGKEPPDDVVWYLEVTRIIEPNPLFGGPQLFLTYVAGEPTQVLPSTPMLELTVEPAPTDGDIDSETVGATPTVATPPGVGLTPQVTTTPLPLTPLSTPGDETPAVPTGEGTPPADATATGTIDPNATPTTPPIGGTPGLPTSTPNPDGYPVASPSPGAYP